MAGRQFGVRDLGKFFSGEPEQSGGRRKVADKGNETEELNGMRDFRLLTSDFFG